jgi:hypothetical protein
MSMKRLNTVRVVETEVVAKATGEALFPSGPVSQDRVRSSAIGTQWIVSIDWRVAERQKVVLFM